jgi:hypothetical protein
MAERMTLGKFLKILIGIVLGSLVAFIALTWLALESGGVAVVETLRPDEGPHRRIRALLRKKCGLRDWWIAAVFDTSHSIAVRLIPISSDTVPTPAGDKTAADTNTDRNQSNVLTNTSNRPTVNRRSIHRHRIFNLPSTYLQPT